MNGAIEQLGGYDSLEFYMLSETANWPVVVNDYTANQITHTPSQLVYDIEEESIQIAVTPKTNENGTIYTIEATCRFLKRSQSLEKYLDKYENQPIVVFGNLQTGHRKLFGTNEEPLYLTYKVEPGKKIEDLGTITLIIKGETRNRPVFY